MPFIITGERIQNMTEKDIQPLFKPDRYISKFKYKVRQDYRSDRQLNKTMGNAQEILPVPTEFLKKNSRKYNRVPCQEEPRCLLPERRPAVPTHLLAEAGRELPVFGESRGRPASRNFLRENVRRAIKSAPPQPSRRFVDSQKGSVQNVESSGLKPRYVFKKNYGSFPRSYSAQHAKTARFAKRDKPEAAPPADQNLRERLGDEERAEILKGLQISLSEKNREFLLLPVIIDTPYLINHKRRVEKVIAQLEKDIEKIESHPVIYVCKD